MLQFKNMTFHHRLKALHCEERLENFILVHKLKTANVADKTLISELRNFTMTIYFLSHPCCSASIYLPAEHNVCYCLCSFSS